MRGEHHRLVGQFQKLSEDRIVLHARIAILKIRAAGAADQQRIAGEDAIFQKITVGIVSVARRIDHIERHAFDVDLVAFGDAHRHNVNAALLAHHGDAMGAIAQRAEAGDVVGV